MPMDADECRRRPLSQGPCSVINHSYDLRLPGEPRGPSESFEWNPVASAQTKQKTRNS